MTISTSETLAPAEGVPSTRENTKQSLMKKFFILLFFPLCAIHAQKKDRIFRSVIEAHDALGYSYNVMILELSDDKCYYLFEQKFTSKRNARKNIPFKVITTNGSWKTNNDTLKLIEKDNAREKFFIMKKKQLVLLFEKQLETSRWIEIK